MDRVAGLEARVRELEAEVARLRAERPVFRRIADELRDQIRAGELPPGDRLPVESELQERWGVARETVRDAVRLLRDEGLVETRHGRGSFVRRR